MKKLVIMVLAMFVLLVSSAFAVDFSVSGSSLELEDAVRRSNPLPEGRDDELDDIDELEYVTFTARIQAGNESFNITGLTFSPSFLFTDPLTDDLNSSYRYRVDGRLGNWVSPDDPIIMNANSTKDILISVLVPSDLDAIDSSFNEQEHSVDIRFEANDGTSQNQRFGFYVENMLEMDEFVLIVDGDEFDCDEDNDWWDLELDCEEELSEIPPRATLSLLLTLANTFDSDEELDFEDVEIDIDADRDLDIDDDSEDIDIDADEEESFTTGFDLDDDIEDGDEYTIDFDVVVIDENGARHGFTHSAEIEFELPEGQVDIEDYSVLPTRVCQGDVATIDFLLENKGSDDQRGVRFQIENNLLDLDKIYTGIRLEDAEQKRSDRSYWDSYTFAVSNSQAPGDYRLRGIVYFEDEDGDDVSAFRDLTLTVEDCTQEDEEDDQDEDDNGSQNNASDGSIVITPPDQGQQDQGQTDGGVSGGPVVAQPVAEEDDVAFVTMLIILIIVLGVVIGYLIYLLAKRR